ncbi:hypothetical protein OG946_18935 [Streptomyces sp. NBC_01808]|uniref:hypothetical protein n=1 Tax=Streptomyces sp. NBC_01808 TaxID=2975947 RepID=UPI002DD97100|nr:hypothetical protein [Streptomyces sp. NBC_01808]WSA39254.1 hypothetical protein OG946_18935 [Streptomyces sp. NBC_01808]
MPLHLNQALQQAIEKGGYTQDDLAEAINEEHEKLYGSPGRCSDRQVRRLLTGEIAWPRDATRLPLEAVLGRRADELGFRRLSALLHTRVALGHSITGQRGRCGQSLHRAEQELDRASPQPPPWLAFCGPAELTGQAALCHYNLGDFTDALQADRQAQTLMGVGEFRRNAFATHVSLARNAQAAGEPEEALAAGHRALDLLPNVRSPRWTTHLRRFGRSLGHGRFTPATAEFMERYRMVAA